MLNYHRIIKNSTLHGSTFTCTNSLSYITLLKDVKGKKNEVRFTVILRIQVALVPTLAHLFSRPFNYNELKVESEIMPNQVTILCTLYQINSLTFSTEYA